MANLKIKFLIGLASIASLSFLAFQLNCFGVQDAYYGSKYFRPFARLKQQMQYNQAVQLNDGRIFLPNWKHSEIFDPKTKKSILVAGMEISPSAPNLLVLKDGNVLFTNGPSSGSATTCYDPKLCQYIGRNTLIFDVSKNQYRWIPFDLAILRRHTATLLPDGKILIVGGVQYQNDKGEPRLPFFDLKQDIAIYDPKTYKTRFIGKLRVHYFDHEVILLNDHQILVIGGHRFNNSKDIIVNDWPKLEKSIELVNYKTGISKILIQESGRNAMLLSNNKLFMPWSYVGAGKIKAVLIDLDNLNKKPNVIEKKCRS